MIAIISFPISSAKQELVSDIYKNNEGIVTQLPKGQKVLKIVVKLKEEPEVRL